MQKVGQSDEASFCNAASCLTSLTFLPRYTISQAKEMFRFTTSRETVSRDGNTNDNVARKSYLLKKEDSTSKPLLNRTHSAIQEERNNKNSVCNTNEEKSGSTTSSFL